MHEKAWTEFLPPDKTCNHLRGYNICAQLSYPGNEERENTETRLTKLRLTNSKSLSQGHFGLRV